jgi:hypothetical protein
MRGFNALRLEMEADGERVIIDSFALTCLDPAIAISNLALFMLSGKVLPYRDSFGFIDYPHWNNIKKSIQIEVQQPTQVHNIRLLRKESSKNEAKKPTESKDKSIAALAGLFLGESLQL